MSQTNENLHHLPLLPVLLGGDMNCYSVARAFHEAYGVRSVAIGRWAMGETKFSRIIDFNIVSDIDTDEVLLATLDAFAKEYPNFTKILIGCTDDYAALIIRNRDVLAANYHVPYIDEPLMNKLISKEDFYNLCDEHKIQYPATVAFHPQDDESVLHALPFAFPCVIKPSSSIDYWKNPFPNMKKVYFANNADEAVQIIRLIFASGYNNSIIVQDAIPGRDNKMHVLTTYNDRHSQVKMMCLGNVLLEEHTPKAVGNHAAILTEYNPLLMETIKTFLEDIKYTGFANFDIKFDDRDGIYKVFEINLRQGRSNYYVTGAGLNIARYVVADHILKENLGEPVLYNGESFWHSIPLEIVWKYTGDDELVQKAKTIVDAGKNTTALGYGFDLRFNPLRHFYLKEHNRRYFKKFAKYCPI